MQEQILKYIIKYKYITFVVIFLLITLFWYSVFTSYFERNDLQAATKSDSLSGEEYFTGGLNYKDNNPYGSYQVGFDELVKNGVSYDDKRYVSDVLTNFVLYHEKIYNAKISYVQDSFKDEGSVPGKQMVYSFKFGVNDSDIHTMKVTSDTVQTLDGEGTIHITVYDNSNTQVFNRSFRVYVSN